MSYIASRYNFFFRGPNGWYLAYNAMSNSFARISPEQYAQVCSLLADPDSALADNPEAVKLQRDLVSGGFLLNEEIDELEVLRLKNRIGRFTTELFGLTIAPTLECNFRCTYCFEERKSQRMTRETEDALIAFVDRKIARARGLGVTWFGGEPLLCLESIERLSEAFARACARHDVRFAPQSVVTNGYLLNRRCAERLRAANIAGAQVTIDGPRDVHDARRRRCDGKGSFDRILDNLAEVGETLRVSVRINVDADNVDRIDELFAEFDRRGLTPACYLGQVVASTEACSSVATKCINTKAFSRIAIAATRRARPFLSADYPIMFQHGVCCADRLNAFVVAPNGYLYKCWSEISFDEARSVGTIFDERRQPSQIRNLTRYMNWDPFANPRCRKCRYLPMCGGGCPFFALQAINKCPPWKYHLQQKLRLKYAELAADPT